MSRLVIYTGGRTGSSAIREELNNHPRITCHGEIFRPNPLAGPGVQKAFAEHGRDYPRLGQTRDMVLPFRLHRDLGPEDPVTPEDFGAYWDYLDSSAAETGADVVGGKILHNHVADTQYFDLARDLGIFTLVLRRRNTLRQAVSAIVAKQTSIHNRKDYTPEKNRSFTIDPAALVSRMKMSRRKTAAHDAILEETGGHYRVVHYEDWVADRAAFFAPIFDALGVDFHLPAGTTFSRRMAPAP